MLPAHGHLEGYAIQVSGLAEFRLSQWREAFLHFVFGMLSGSPNVTYRPQIVLNSLGLVFETECQAYYVRGWNEQNDPRPPQFGESDLRVVVPSQVNVEHALLQFVKNNRIRVLVIELWDHNGEDATLTYWKSRERGLLSCRVDPR